MWQSRTPTSASRKSSLNNRTTTSPPFSLLAILLLVGMFIGAHQRQARNHSSTSPIITVSHLVVYPFQLATSNLRYAGLSGWGMFGDVKRLQAENAQLKSEKAALELENKQLQLSLSRLQSVATQVRMLPSGQKKAVHAAVIGWLPNDAEMITLGRGSREGVTNDAIVRTGKQLIGRVVETSPLSANVLLLTDSFSQVHVNVYRKPALGKPASGIVKPSLDIFNTSPTVPTSTNTPLTSDTLVPVGRGVLVGTGRDERGVANPLTIKWIGNEQEVKTGDIVLTSGKGRIFPKDIPVGTILKDSLQNDPTASLKIAKVQPFEAIPDNINQVFILPKLESSGKLESGSKLESSGKLENNGN